MMKISVVKKQKLHYGIPQVENAFRSIIARPLSSPSELNSMDCDVLHLYDLLDVQHIYPFAERAHQLGIPMVLTPNYWSPYEFFHESARSWQDRLVRTILPHPISMIRFERRYEKNISPEIFKQHEKVVNWSHSVITRSSSERTLFLTRYSRCYHNKVKVVKEPPVTLDLDKINAAEFYDAYDVTDFVLCVGDFNEFHNQLGLVRALRRTNIPIVFIGEVHPGNEYYVKQCKQAARKIDGKILFVNHWRSTTMIGSALKNARVLVIPSWWETSLRLGVEALLCGCNLVVTDRSPYREYLGQLSFLCSPRNQESMRHSVLRAYAVERKVERVEECRRLWERTLAPNLNDIYFACISGKNGDLE